MAHLPPNPRWLPVEKIALRVIVYGTAAIIVAACFFIAWLVFTYSLFSNYLYRAGLLIVLIIIIFQVPSGVRTVYKEVARRGG